MSRSEGRLADVEASIEALDGVTHMVAVALAETLINLARLKRSADLQGADRVASDQVLERLDRQVKTLRGKYEELTRTLMEAKSKSAVLTSRNGIVSFKDDLLRLTFSGVKTGEEVLNSLEISILTREEIQEVTARGIRY